MIEWIVVGFLVCVVFISICLRCEKYEKNKKEIELTPLYYVMK